MLVPDTATLNRQIGEAKEWAYRQAKVENLTPEQLDSIQRINTKDDLSQIVIREPFTKDMEEVIATAAPPVASAELPSFFFHTQQSKDSTIILFSAGREKTLQVVCYIVGSKGLPLLYTEMTVCHPCRSFISDH